MMLNWHLLPIEMFPQITLPEDSPLKFGRKMEDGSELHCGIRIVFRYFKLLALLSWRQKCVMWNLFFTTLSFFVDDLRFVDMSDLQKYPGNVCYYRNCSNPSNLLSEIHNKD